MIWLPGVLSQGGKKYVWGRYRLVYALQRENLGVKTYAQTSSSMVALQGYSIDQATGKITLTRKTTLGGGAIAGNIYYNINESLEYDYGSYQNLSVAYENHVLTRDVSGTYPVLTYQCYKITTILDKEFLDTVESSDPDDYPVEGQQGDYWYVRYSDTPITWERYAFAEGLVQGETVQQSASRSTYFYRATGYSTSGKTFTASVSRTQASSLAVGNYLIQSNGSFAKPSNNATSGTVSGDTLYEITSKTGSSTVTLDFATYTIGDIKGSYIDTVTSYNPYEYPDDGAQDGYWYVRVESGGSTSGVNYVGYIESTGTQFIDTEYVPNDNTRVEMTFQLTNPDSTNQAIFGTAGQFSFRWYGSGSRFRSNGSNNVDFATSIDKNAKHTVAKTATQTTIDGTYSVNTTAGNVSLSLYLFAQQGTSGMQNPAKLKCWEYKIYESDVLLHNYRPCLDPDGVACMYDEVNTEYVYNAGSGTFAYGTEA